MKAKILALLALAALPAAASSQPVKSLTASQAHEAELAADPATLAARAAVAHRFTPVVGADAVARVGALADGIILTQGLPPPPGGDQGGSLPPPPGQERRGGSLPPPPGGGRLPPPPGGGSLPPPPGFDPLPRPIFPGGPLPRGDRRLEDAERTYDQDGEYLGYWDGARGFDEARGEVVTRPGEGDSYSMVLRSEETQRQTVFVRKQDGLVYWYPRSRHIDTETRRVVMRFVNRSAKPLLPWERERFTVTFKGDRSRNGGVELETASGSYRYTYAVRFDPMDRDTVILEMTAQEKLLTSADENGVTVTLAADGRGGLKLVVTDRWGSYYAGETLLLAVRVKKDSGSMWRRDAVVFETTGRSPHTQPIPAGAADGVQFELPVTTTGAGEYYLDAWSFQRSGSRLSRADWMNRGRGNRIRL
ncbi:MAG: hypothetical protein SF051_10390 [Elusimicrobiota bacterium]|nr:hypothetical protein [Elusimicrobiota bacterium]